MNVETGTEVAQFPENQYINGIFVAVCETTNTETSLCGCLLVFFPVPVPREHEVECLKRQLSKLQCER
jgi:hypothetical protein